VPRSETPSSAEKAARNAPSVDEVRRLLARYRRSAAPRTEPRTSRFRRASSVSRRSA
jgi:hypothetical protein